GHRSTFRLECGGRSGNGFVVNFAGGYHAYVDRGPHVGTPLDDTLTILMVPPKRESPPQQDLLEHYYSMTLSKCFRGSGEKLSCISCHAPPVEPRPEEAAAYFKTKCLACHTEKSCTL